MVTLQALFAIIPTCRVEVSPWMPLLGSAWCPARPVELAVEMSSFNSAVGALWQSGSLHECVEAIRSKRKIDRFIAFAAGAIAQFSSSPEGRAHCEQVCSSVHYG